MDRFKVFIFVFLNNKNKADIYTFERLIVNPLLKIEIYVSSWVFPFLKPHFRKF